MRTFLQHIACHLVNLRYKDKYILQSCLEQNCDLSQTGMMLEEKSPQSSNSRIIVDTKCQNYYFTKMFKF